MASTPKKSSKKSDAEHTIAVKVVPGMGHPLYPDLGEAGEGLLVTIMKAAAENESSKQGVASGIKSRPFNFNAVAEFKAFNPHHSACIDAKKISTVGLGHVSKETHKKLNPFTNISWKHTLLQVSEDYENLGNAYLEVVRSDPSADAKITGLHWMPARDVWVNIENDQYDLHFEVIDRGSASQGSSGIGKKFAKFGDLDGFFARHKITEQDAKRKHSELIHFPEPSALSRYYGVPNWLAAVAYIELAQAMVQHQFDFHLNRGVPEFMLFVIGVKLRNQDWKKIEDSLKAQIGLGNTHKSIALNIPSSEAKVQIEKLAGNESQDGEFFRNMVEALSMNVVSAHRVPPALAGILIPGKMGATNELSNAVLAFQALVIGPKQDTIEEIFDCTLGDSTRNGGLGLKPGDFELQTVITELSEALEKMRPMDTVGRMKDDMGQAATEDRDIADGLQKSAFDKMSKPARLLLSQLAMIGHNGM
jgi:hypothetical protein